MKNIVLEAKKSLFSSTYNGHDSLAAFEKAVQVQSTMEMVGAVTNVGFSRVPVTSSLTILAGDCWRCDCMVESLRDMA